MTIENPQLVTVLILCMAGMLFAQALLFVFVLVRTEQKMREMETAMARLSKLAGSSLAATREILEKLGWLPEVMVKLDVKIASMLDAMLHGLGKANDGLEGGIDRVNRSIDDVSRRVDYGLMLFTRQTSRVRRGLRYPALNFSALIHGIKVGLQTLKGERRTPTRSIHDDENFI